MRQSISTLLSIVCFVACADAAETVQAPLPGLQGYYVDTQTESRSDTFALQAGMPTAISHIWITVEGSIGNGMYGCPWHLPMPIDAPYDLRFTAVIPDPATGGSWTALIGQNLGSPIEFIPENGASWDFLPMNAGVVTLVAWHYSMYCSGEDLNVYNPAPALIFSAVLTIEGDFVVAVESFTWGSIKALYR